MRRRDSRRTHPVVSGISRDRRGTRRQTGGRQTLLARRSDLRNAGVRVRRSDVLHKYRVRGSRRRYRSRNRNWANRRNSLCRRGIGRMDANGDGRSKHFRWRSKQHDMDRRANRTGRRYRAAGHVAQALVCVDVLVNLVVCISRFRPNLRDSSFRPAVIGPVWIGPHGSGMFCRQRSWGFGYRSRQRQTMESRNTLVPARRDTGSTPRTAIIVLKLPSWIRRGVFPSMGICYGQGI